MSIRHHVKAASTVTAVLTISMALPAQANVRHFTDARGDTSSSVDIWSVVVDNSTAHRDKVVVLVRQHDVRANDSISIYLDTRPADPGPEYVIAGATTSEYGMRHLERWNGRGKAVPYRCGYSLMINDSTERSRAVIPRACIGNPGKIRVAVKVTRDFPPTSRDWAKSYRTWFGAVSR